MPETVAITDTVALALRRALAAAAPREFVGVLGGRRDGATWRVDAFLPLPNGATTRDAFAVDPIDFARAEAALRARGRAWLGFAHGHPDGPAVPSARDRAAFWPDCLQAVVGARGDDAAVRVYWRDGAGCRELAAAPAARAAR